MITHTVSALHLVMAAARLSGYQRVACWRLHFSGVSCQSTGALCFSPIILKTGFRSFASRPTLHGN